MTFTTWRSLCLDQGLDNAAAVEVMVCVATAVAENC